MCQHTDTTWDSKPIVLPKDDSKALAVRTSDSARLLTARPQELITIMIIIKCLIIAAKVTALIIKKAVLIAVKIALKVIAKAIAIAAKIAAKLSIKAGLKLLKLAAKKTFIAAKKLSIKKAAAALKKLAIKKAKAIMKKLAKKLAKKAKDKLLKLGKKFSKKELKKFLKKRMKRMIKNAKKDLKQQIKDRIKENFERRKKGLPPMAENENPPLVGAVNDVSPYQLSVADLKKMTEMADAREKDAKVQSKYAQRLKQWESQVYVARKAFEAARSENLAIAAKMIKQAPHCAKPLQKQWLEAKFKFSIPRPIRPETLAEKEVRLEAEGRKQMQETEREEQRQMIKAQKLQASLHQEEAARKRQDEIMTHRVSIWKEKVKTWKHRVEVDSHAFEQNKAKMIAQFNALQGLGSRTQLDALKNSRYIPPPRPESPEEYDTRMEREAEERSTRRELAEEEARKNAQSQDQFHKWKNIRVAMTRNLGWPHQRDNNLKFWRLVHWEDDWSDAWGDLTFAPDNILAGGPINVTIIKMELADQREFNIWRRDRNIDTLDLPLRFQADNRWWLKHLTWCFDWKEKYSHFRFCPKVQKQWIETVSRDAFAKWKSDCEAVTNTLPNEAQKIANRSWLFFLNWSENWRQTVGHLRVAPIVSRWQEEDRSRVAFQAHKKWLWSQIQTLSTHDLRKMDEHWVYWLHWTPNWRSALAGLRVAPEVTRKIAEDASRAEFEHWKRTRPSYGNRRLPNEHLRYWNREWFKWLTWRSDWREIWGWRHLAPYTYRDLQKDFPRMLHGHNAIHALSVEANTLSAPSSAFSKKDERMIRKDVSILKVIRGRYGNNFKIQFGKDLNLPGVGEEFASRLQDVSDGKRKIFGMKEQLSGGNDKKIADALKRIFGNQFCNRLKGIGKNMEKTKEILKKLQRERVQCKILADKIRSIAKRNLENRMVARGKKALQHVNKCLKKNVPILKGSKKSRTPRRSGKKGSGFAKAKKKIPTTHVKKGKPTAGISKNIVQKQASIGLVHALKTRSQTKPVTKSKLLSDKENQIKTTSPTETIHAQPSRVGKVVHKVSSISKKSHQRFPTTTQNRMGKHTIHKILSRRVRRVPPVQTRPQTFWSRDTPPAQIRPYWRRSTPPRPWQPQWQPNTSSYWNRYPVQYPVLMRPYYQNRFNQWQRSMQSSPYQLVTQRNQRYKQSVEQFQTEKPLEKLSGIQPRLPYRHLYRPLRQPEMASRLVSNRFGQYSRFNSPFNTELHKKTHPRVSDHESHPSDKNAPKNVNLDKSENDLKEFLRSIGLRNRQQLRRIEHNEQMRDEHGRTRRAMRRQTNRLERDLDK